MEEKIREKLAEWVFYKTHHIAIDNLAHNLKFGDSREHDNKAYNMADEILKVLGIPQSLMQKGEQPPELVENPYPKIVCNTCYKPLNSIDEKHETHSATERGMVNCKGYGYERVEHKIWQEGYEACQQWVSVEDRLPEDGELVLTTIIRADNGCSNVMILAHNGDNWRSDAWEYNVTHWMPLPQPPKEG